MATTLKTIFYTSLLVKLILGLRNVEPPPLMVYEGNEATEGMFPSVGSVFLMDYRLRIVRCGATLIGNEWAISAAHCFYDETTGKPKNFLRANIILGDVDYTIRSNWHQEASFDYVIHERYNHTTDQNDIALLHLKENIETTEYVKPEKLSGSSSAADTYENCQVAGWGKKSEYVLTTKLLYANLSLTKNSQCEDTWHNFNNSTMVCAGSITSDACMGDSGGPLYCKNKNTMQTELVGIVSFGFSKCYPSVTGVYTKVFAYENWIKNKTENLLMLWITIPCVVGVVIIFLIIILVIYKIRQRKTESGIYESMHNQPNPSEYTRLT